MTDLITRQPRNREQRDERDQQVRLIRDSVARLVTDRGGVRRARQLRYGQAGIDPICGVNCVNWAWWACVSPRIAAAPVWAWPNTWRWPRNWAVAWCRNR